MTGRRRSIPAILLSLLLVIATLVPVSYLALHGNHVCTHVACATCERLQTARNSLFGAGLAAARTSISTLMRSLLFLSLLFWGFHIVPNTPVRLRVRMNH